MRASTKLRRLIEGDDVIVARGTQGAIDAGAGDDLLASASGGGRLTGGEGADTFVLSPATGDIVITADIPLAARCLARGAYALGTNGREFSPDSMGQALAVQVLT